MAEEYLYQSEGFLGSMREILQRIKDTVEYKNYTANYRQMVDRKTLARWETFMLAGGSFILKYKEIG